MRSIGVGMNKLKLNISSSDDILKNLSNSNISEQSITKCSNLNLQANNTSQNCFDLYNYKQIRQKEANKLNFSETLKGKEKIKYIKKLINDSNSKSDPFDCLITQRKKCSIGSLIRQFDSKLNNFEENIFKKPYPLIYCLSNRRLENNSSDLLTRILFSQKKVFFKRDNNRYGLNSHNFYSDIDVNKSKQYIKKLKMKRELTSLKKSEQNFPIANKFIKSKISNYNQSIFFQTQKMKKDNNISTHISLSFIDKLYLKNKIDKVKNYKNAFKHRLNRLVCLDNHDSNTRNLSVINERINLKIDNYIYGIKRRKIEPRFNEVIKGLSDLKSNNKIMAFNSSLRLL